MRVPPTSYGSGLFGPRPLVVVQGKDGRTRTMSLKQARKQSGGNEPEDLFTQLVNWVKDQIAKIF